MTTPKLTTLAIGGPCAGQVLTGSYGLLSAIVQEPLPEVVTAMQEPTVAVTMRRAIYREQKLAWTTDKGEHMDFKFWVHESIQGGDAIIRELIGNYRPVAADYSF